ncbi:MFS transporter [Intrasporangium calvum]|uniref:MFS transporter n=1 Tax=Intrasporangium calvum TaxID=53358 RepID=UPI000DF5DC94|nr:aromatic acid/H+ symport family MFS transporter [Intrasporangium calvum]AXG14752.1 MFS transporter [Intrasporangium calvum]
MATKPLNPPNVATALGTRPAWLVTLLCWLIVVFDGYDLIVYGTTIPALLEEPGWHLTPATAGFVGSLAFAGMLIGALGAGYLADRLGRRRTILWCTLWFSLFTALCAIATTPEIFGLFRFIAGLGLGGLVPSANALTAEFVSRKHRSAVSTIMMSGVPIGGSAAALVGLWLLPELGWRSMYAVAFLAVVVLLPLCFVLLPESPTWLRAHGRRDEALAVEARYSLVHDASEHSGEEHAPGFRTILSGQWRRPTVLFAAATVATLFAWYGLGTWLPKLMGSDARFEMGQPLHFLLALNLGAVLGSVVTAWAGVRFGPLRSAIFAAAAAALGLAFLLTYPTDLLPIYGALILAGVGTHGTQCLIIAAVATHYPSRLRGTSLGFALGVGRIGAVLAPQVGGWLLAAGLGVGSNFLAFSIAAGIAAVLLLITMLATRPAAQPADIRDQLLVH